MANEQGNTADMVPIKSRDEYPHRLNVQDITEILRVGRKAAYQIVNRADFPKVKIGNRFLIPRDRFF